MGTTRRGPPDHPQLYSTGHVLTDSTRLDSADLVLLASSHAMHAKCQILVGPGALYFFCLRGEAPRAYFSSRSSFFVVAIIYGFDMSYVRR